ncbi:MAG: endo-1,4-beta-xylanase [Asticcacaulis sp.]
MTHLPHRRRMLQGLAGVGAASVAMYGFSGCAKSNASDFVPLKDLAAAKGLRFGTAVSVKRDMTIDPKIAELIIRECNIIVPENELKMYVTHNNNANDYNFAPADKLLEFAESHKMAMRGHNIVWARDKYTPGWLTSYDFGPNPKVAAEKMLRDYVAKIADHYGDRLTSWDVVNETVDPQTGEVRDHAFGRVLGMDALRIAFEATREHLPKTQLVYNDYMSWEAGNEKHRDGVLKLMRWFHDNHVPVDALGVQSHIGNGFDLTAGQPKEWGTFLDNITNLGYDLLITEMDVDDVTIKNPDIKVRDELVAKVARDYLDQMLSYKQTKDVLFWGLDDETNWLQGFTPREDKLPLRPTLYDVDYQPKLLRQAVADAFKAASPRS